MTVSGISNLQAEIARQIVALSAEEQWAPGERVSDVALAKKLGVSRSPVRAALALLAGRGLLAHEPGRGFVLARLPSGEDEMNGVAPPSEIEDLYMRVMADRAGGALADEVSEAELAERYGATRGAVRKVLMRFAAEGLARRLRGHGWAFTESLDTDEAVAESYQFRLVVECGALRQPGFRVDPEQLANVRAQQEAVLRAPPASIRRDHWFRVNALFHETLVGWSRNRFLVQAVRQQNNLRRMTEYADFDKLSAARIHDACAEHIAILDALADGDVDFAEALLRRHIERASRDLAGED
ncbi:GntR family transcriptional regulator [Chelatococcus sp. SYSU_G07232]|uniref:GntR family transcriptional regulator n=1 Tax=Chelatococcus albus TaxID=3047466 RepID=A0ABT7AIC6_9HYPH|nr:GntR family transcriptional regulator [Chelatococcus sp. SYSU_G07232]MDJ1159134.1 GntR family transcriptional regulator [Chelatococcus sp. SYSU_G07232]